MGRAVYDWEAIEREYRAGQLSIREIARRFEITEGAIRKRAKQNRWTRSLIKKVRDGVRNEVVRREVRISNATEREITEAAIDRGVEVELNQRQDIRQARKVVKLLTGQLAKYAEARDEIEAEIEAETKEDKNPRRRGQMLRAVSLPSHAATVRDLSTALKNLITLERKAYRLDDELSSELLEAILEGLPDDFARAVRRKIGETVSESGN